MTTPIIAVANGKGGVGKTTTAVNLAHALSRHAPTLLVDMDAQGHATTHLGADPRALDAEGQTMARVLRGQTRMERIHINLFGATGEYTIEQVLRGADYSAYIAMCDAAPMLLAPAGPSLADAEIHLSRDMGGPGVLRDALADLLADYPAYRAVVIDCPPHFGALSANALVAATHLLIPVQTEALACDGVPAVLANFSASRRLNPALDLLGILPTMYNARLAIHRDALAELQATYGNATTVWPPIPRAAAYPQSAAQGRATAMVRPKAPGLDVFAQIAAQVMGGRP